MIIRNRFTREPIRLPDKCPRDSVLTVVEWCAMERRAGRCGASLRGADIRDADLRGADLWDADVRDADIRDADLRGADLWDADIRDADLRGADLWDADLCGASLRGADLRGANLRNADLWGADVRDADLTGTCLDPAAPIPPVTDEQILSAGMIPRRFRGRDRVYGWRTATSMHVGATEYRPGRWYRAPWFSVAETDCHPGIYLSGMEWLRAKAAGRDLVPCWCYRDELHLAGGKWRARRICVLREAPAWMESDR